MKCSLQNTEFLLGATRQLYYCCDPHLGYLSNSCFDSLNPLKAELNPICHLEPLLGGATAVVFSRLRVNDQKKFLYRRMFFNIYLREKKGDANKHAIFHLLEKQT